MTGEFPYDLRTMLRDIQRRVELLERKRQHRGPSVAVLEERVASLEARVEALEAGP